MRPAKAADSQKLFLEFFLNQALAVQLSTLPNTELHPFANKRETGRNIGTSSHHQLLPGNRILPSKTKDKSCPWPVKPAA